MNKCLSSFFLLEFNRHYMNVELSGGTGVEVPPGKPTSCPPGDGMHLHVSQVCTVALTLISLQNILLCAQCRLPAVVL